MQDFYSMIGFSAEAHAPADIGTLEAPGPDAALFLDFDGTLVDIAERPDAITVPPSLIDMLNRLCERHDGAVAIVSGRDISDLSTHLEGFAGALAGGHGGQVKHAGGQVSQTSVDPVRLATLQAAAEAFALVEPGLHVERKSGGVVLHYRSAPELEEKVRAFAHALADPDPDFVCQPAKMACEIKPHGVSKGAAIERLMREPPFVGRKPVFAGDDRTDETGFEFVNANDGISIKIGEGQTEAGYHIDSPPAFRDWLAALAGERA